MTRRAFAGREGLRYSTFCDWTKRAERAPASALRPHQAPVRFTEVAWPASASGGGLEVRLADGTVVHGGSVEELAALVRWQRQLFLPAQVAVHGRRKFWAHILAHGHLPDRTLREEPRTTNSH